MVVLNVLRALRFESRSPAFVEALLGALLDATGAPDDEAQRIGLAPSTRMPRPAPDAPPMPGDPDLRRWLLRVRRTLRRHAGVALADVVRRDAWVSADATHVDVVYPLSGVDLRLRRRGLDADPGWVPWLGRIVAFHFVADDRLPGRPQGA